MNIRKVYCCKCGKPSDRGCIAICKDCSGWEPPKRDRYVYVRKRNKRAKKTNQANDQSDKQPGKGREVSRTDTPN